MEKALCTDGRTNLKTLNNRALTEFIADLGEPAYRARQVWQWLWQKGAAEFSQMTNLSKPLREKLEQRSWIGNLKIVTRQQSLQDGTTKYLFKLTDGETIESVLMRHNYGLSVCVSTQVGCRMGCGFCASTTEGMVRNLEAWEIYDQVVRAQEDAGSRVSSVVIMGMGEPLDNYAQVLEFIRLINHAEGLNIGQRHITLSTCGVVPKINDLALENLDITLSISLHATTDQVRNEIMPINRKYPIAVLLQACGAYIATTKRRITFEYAIMSGVNDSSEEAHNLGRLLKGLLCHVNLIPVNPVEGKGFAKPSLEKVRAFQKVVESYGMETTVRRELGTDIDAACGQLRRRLAT
ncbi:MAG: 23S rRNA (adenine(2503)-C(2))-methyltransferase RlmN [Carboxydocellales bacterium]